MDEINILIRQIGFDGRSLRGWRSSEMSAWNDTYSEDVVGREFPFMYRENSCKDAPNADIIRNEIQKLELIFY